MLRVAADGAVVFFLFISIDVYLLYEYFAGVGLKGAWFPSPLPRGGPGGARTREIACFLARKPIQNSRNGRVGGGPDPSRTREIEGFRFLLSLSSFPFFLTLAVSPLFLFVDTP